jgi:hypothetical protein
MVAFEDASVNQNIAPFTALLADLFRKGLEAKPLPKISSQTFSYPINH